MISKHRSTNWVRTWGKCGIAALGMKAWEELRNGAARRHYCRTRFCGMP